MGKTAVIVDTCVVRNGVTLEEMLDNSHTDYFITNQVRAELNRWETIEGGKYDREKSRIQEDLAETRKSCTNRNYQDILEYVHIHEEIEGLAHNNCAARIFYEGFKAPIQIEFMKSKSALQTHFLQLAETYRDVLDTKNLTIEVTPDHAIVRLNGVKKKANTQIPVESKKELDTHFLDFDQIERQYLGQLTALDEKHSELLNGRQIIKYFDLNPDRVIAHETDPFVAAYADSPMKSIVSELCAENRRMLRDLNQKDIARFVKEASARWVDKVAGNSFTSDLNSVFSLLADRTRTYVCTLIDKKDGYVPRNNTSTDANLVSAALNMQGYKSVTLLTRDLDVVMIFGVCKAYKPPEHRVACEFI